MSRKKLKPAIQIDTSSIDSEAIDKLVGSRIRLRRKMLRMSQDNVACMLGITFQQFQKYEIGESKVSASRLYLIGKILGVGVGYFFTPLPTSGNPEEFFVREDMDNPLDPMQNPEVRRIAYALMRVGDEKKRRSIVDFVSSMTDSEKSPAPE